MPISTAVKAAVGVISLANLASAWLPGYSKLRGVNMGSQYIIEPWMAGNEWNIMGCGAYQSEFDCVSGLGQDAANTAFQAHWNRWVPESDFDEMLSYGINTIRIPIGYWMDESTVDLSSEHFPQGGFDHLKGFCDAAANRGFYIILDLHGAPGAQQAQQPFTGQYAPTPGFYNDYNYGRAVNFHTWIAQQVHTTNEFRNVGMIEIVNEPLNGGNSVDSLRSEFYVNAYNAIRNVESSLGVSENNQLHVQFMGSLWGSGNPTQYLNNPTNVVFDDHRYLKWDPSVPLDQNSYISTSCNDNRGPDGPTIVGEWSLSVADSVQSTDAWNQDTNKNFYTRWFSAQVQNYEKNLGWIFWSWKTDLEDYRWGYQNAVAAGVIDTNINNALSLSVC